MKTNIVSNYIEPLTIEQAEVTIISLGKNMQEHAYLAGKILIWVKSQLNHGQFEVWIERKLWFTPRTARNFMQFAEKCDEKGKLLEKHYTESIKSEKFADLKEPKGIPDGKFNVIYADPPWSYSNSGFDESANRQYPTMTNEEIFELIEKINPHITDEAVLFLWVTAPLLNIGFQTCEAWSFQYKQNMVWIKNRGPSMGWFVQSRHEHLFISTRGEGVHPEVRPVSYFEYPVTKHSAKPYEIYDLIEKMYPNGKYLELFARNIRNGWESWGNQV